MCKLCNKTDDKIRVYDIGKNFFYGLKRNKEGLFFVTKEPNSQMTITPIKDDICPICKENKNGKRQKSKISKTRGH